MMPALCVVNDSRKRHKRAFAGLGWVNRASHKAHPLPNTGDLTEIQKIGVRRHEFDFFMN
jgi:hypothetical protein